MKFKWLIFLMLPIVAQAADPIKACTQAGRYWDVHDARCRLPHQDKAAPAIDPAPGCFWQSARAVLDAQHALRFRYQNCGKRIPYVVDRARGILYNAHEGAAHPVLQFWPYQPGALQDAIAALSRTTLQPDEELDCALTYIAPARGFTYQPNSDYLADLQEEAAQGEAVSACGAYGATDTAIQFFRILNDKMLVFLHLHLRREPLDPTSVTLEILP